MKLLKSVCTLLLISMVFFSCEKQEYFKSESTIKSEIGHTWHRIQISHLQSDKEYWTFSDGKLTIVDSVNHTLLQGEYSVNTTVTKVFVTTSNFTTGGAADYDGNKWQVIQLDGSVLQIAGDSPSSGGLIQREFTRQ
jgi:hypothetical protein